MGRGRPRGLCVLGAGLTTASAGALGGPLDLVWRSGEVAVHLPTSRWDELEAHTIAGWAVVRDAAGRAAAPDADSARARYGAAFASPVMSNELGQPVIVTPEVFVRLAPGGDAAGLEAAMAARGLAVLERDWRGMAGVYRARSAARDGLAVLAQARDLAGRGDVAFAEPDMVVTGRGALVPNDPLFPQQWGLLNTGQAGGVAGIDVRASAAWDITRGSPTVRVVVLDTGVDASHPDLAMSLGKDFTGQGLTGGPMNLCDNHGTASAGLIGARLNNGVGVSGVAPGVEMVSARFAVSNPGTPCDGSWSTLTSWAADAIAWAPEAGARVVSNGNVFGFTSSLVESSIATIRAAGVVHVASAGNAGSASVAYPASVSGVLAVGSVGRDGARTATSNYGPGVAFVAPGVDLWTTDRAGVAGYVTVDYVTFGGTSASASLVAGVAALVLSARPSLSVSQVEAVLRATSRDLGPTGYDLEHGWGLPSARAALAVLGAPGPCAANCDGSTTFPALNALDFACFLSRYRDSQGLPSSVQAIAYANCDGSTTFPQLNALDFGCFLSLYRAGCP